MNLRIHQKIMLFLVWMVIYVMMFIDFLEDFPTRISKGTIRVGLIGIVTLGLFYSYSIEQKKPYFYSRYIPDMESQQQILGLQVEENPYPIKISENPFPKITARSVVVYDNVNEKYLYKLNSQERLAPASTTKMLTGLVALDTYSLDELLTVPESCTKLDSQKVNLLVDESINVKDLIYSMVINSAGDSACTLSLSKLPINEFITLINNKAQEIGMESSFFDNAIGFDSENGSHYSTAEDLLLLSLETSKNPILSDASKLTSYNFESGERLRRIYTTNYMLNNTPGSVGIKTGTTEEAKEVLLYRYNKDSIDLYIVVMGSEDRFLDTKNILNWVLNSYSWES